jgi:hypothetical protein
VAIALVLGATGMTLAGHGGTRGSTTKLWPTADSPFPNATGRVTTTCNGPYYNPWTGRPYYTILFGLEAYGLAPDTAYSFYPYDPDYKYGMYYGMSGFITDGNGNFSSGSAPFSATMPEKPPTPDFEVADLTTGFLVLASKVH